MAAVTEFVSNVNQYIINPLIGLLFTLALVMFLYGGAQFILRASEDEGRETGKQHMIWGVIGMFIMISVFGILGVVTNTFGISLPQ
ncbi:hypothetical protein IIB50_00080 [Patescibacteria group bacterium]|nr:hypothetical protein [Patescibacteria group bacterium]